MAQLKIVKAEEIQPESIRGSNKVGQVKRIIATEKFFFNIDEVNPGYSPHHWHRHTKYKTETHEVDYPPDFEEIYHILSGQGVIQWKTDSGEMHEQKVGPGDTIFMPPDVVEHQLLNDGSETIRMAVVGVPPSRRTPLR
jgi:oxalate decarboxylase/phosphoglucose isomerase-like protein (cupin superfamily)